MSKKYKRKARRKPTLHPLIWMIGGGILLIGAALFMGYNSGMFDTGTPALSVDQEVIQYGDVRFNVPLTFAITVTNNGDGTLRFKDEPYIEVREGC